MHTEGCGHSASYTGSKHCVCHEAHTCTGEHCSVAHAAHGGADRSGFDLTKCPGCACVSSDKMPLRTIRVISGMHRWYASAKRNASTSDCQYVCLTEESAWCRCAAFRKDGTCTLRGNLTDKECSRRGGLSRDAMLLRFSGGLKCVCHQNATARRKATTTRPSRFSAELIIAHCVQPMTWLGGFLSELGRAGALVVRITIVAKCGLSKASHAYGDLPAGVPSPQLHEVANVGRYVAALHGALPPISVHHRRCRAVGRLPVAPRGPTHAARTLAGQAPCP